VASFQRMRDAFRNAVIEAFGIPNIVLNPYALEGVKTLAEAKRTARSILNDGPSRRS
jgi:hypothetical protein